MNGFNAIDGLNNLTVFILNAIAVIGIAACAWGALQFALALKSQQPEQRTHAMLYIAGGLVMVGVRVMLQTLGVSVPG
ncbi:MAG: glutamyl-tRNA amidotransferase [Christensenellaceae bacterium]|nr:glutamyl-tRNA amidotransferase [Christensenellaceae bacterium]